MFTPQACLIGLRRHKPLCLLQGAIHLRHECRGSLARGVESSKLELLQQLLSDSELVYFQPFLYIIEDELDNRILETALKGKANYLVTGDKLLLKLQRYKNIKIVNVRDFLEIIDA